MRDPIQVFNAHWQLALDSSPLKQKNAVCISTIDRNGFPNSRFVDLKEADTRGLVFCTYLDSQKGHDISLNSKAGLTVWWDHIGIQARFQGSCVQICDEEADRHWKARSRDAQLTTTTFHQSQPLHDPGELQTKMLATRLQHHNKEIQRPARWGGFRLVPNFLEILEFKEDRLHIRTCYSRDNEAWKIIYLQP